MNNIIWKPQPRQAAFLARGEYEALYGGAAGGGKSDALIAEALRQVHIPHYRAIIFRKTFPECRQLIDRSLAVYAAAYPKAKCGCFPAELKYISGLCSMTATR